MGSALVNAGAVVPRELVDAIDGMVFRCRLGPDPALLFVSEGCDALTGYAPQELHGPVWAARSFVHPEDRAHVLAQLDAASRGVRRYRLQYRIVRRNGEVRFVEESGRATRDASGARLIDACVCDVSDHIDVIERLRNEQMHHRELFDGLVVGVFQTSTDGRYLAANTALARMYGFDSPVALMAELRNIDACLYVDPCRREAFRREIRERGQVSDFESEIYRRDGTTLWISENARAVSGPDGEVLYYLGTVEDISERRFYRAQLEFHANHDTLTGLPNRNALRERLEQARLQASVQGGEVAVAFLDLDHFKVVNDGLGHAAGDRLVVEVGRRIRETLRASDAVIRYGGDEFVLILHHAGGRAMIEQVLGRVREAVALPVEVDGQDLFVTCSVGVAMFDTAACTVATLLRDADAAMYSAKTLGRNSVVFHSSDHDSVVARRLALENGLRQALERGEIEVWFQPKVDRERRMLSCEALARWRSAEFGLIAPSAFIALAEEIGVIEPITHFVLETACREVAAWSRHGGAAIGVAVNLSSRMFRSGRLVPCIEDILARSGLAAERLELEITEGTLMGKGLDVVEQLEALKVLGARIAVDDFGTGYSSFAYLCNFPVDILKIDKSFVQRAVPGSQEAILADAIVSLGRKLGMTVVAEGIETEDQFQTFAMQGCHEFQGYLFSRPLPPERFGELFVDRREPVAGAQRGARPSEDGARRVASGSPVALHAPPHALLREPRSHCTPAAISTSATPGSREGATTGPASAPMAAPTK